MRKRPRKNDDVHNGFGEWVICFVFFFFKFMNYLDHDVLMFLAGRLYGCKKVQT